MNIDERLEKLTERQMALADSLVSLHDRVDVLIRASAVDGVNIRVLLCIAESRVQRLSGPGR
jgi:hypothetical protein